MSEREKWEWREGEPPDDTGTWLDENGVEPVWVRWCDLDTGIPGGWAPVATPEEVVRLVEERDTERQAREKAEAERDALRPVVDAARSLCNGPWLNADIADQLGVVANAMRALDAEDTL